jgi:hypothetical protein
MKRSLAGVYRALVCCALLAAHHLACPFAAAQQHDEAWVISQIAAGNFEELRSIEKLSGRGVPFAMHWWGIILERCVFERCDKNAARELILRAAIAGHGRAQMQVFAAAESREEFDELVAKIGVPPGGPERFAYISKALLLINFAPQFGGKPRPDDGKLRTQLLTMAKSEPQIAMRTIAVVQQGPTSGDLEVLAETGFDAISELLMQRAVINKISDRQIIERAKAGKLSWAAAYCDSLMIRTGRTELDRDELDVCEKAAAAGFPAAVRGLLTHHQFAGSTRAAQYFADLCEEILGARCADQLSEYYSARGKESAEFRAKWEFWDLVAANMLIAKTNVIPGGVSEEELRGKTPGLRRRLFQLIVRTDLIGQTCGMQRLDPATGAVEANPQCPWRRPIVIPAEFLSGAK